MMNVRFKFGTQAQYDAIVEKDPYTLYWLLDTQNLYKGTTLFGKGSIATQILSGLMSPLDKTKLDSLYSTTQIDEMLETKQDVLISGQNIKTLEGISLLGKGVAPVGIVFKGYYSDGVFYADRELTIPLNPSVKSLFIDQTVINDQVIYAYTGEEYVVIGRNFQVPDATPSVKGIAKLYDDLGENTDGSINQQVITQILDTKVSASFEDNTLVLE